MPRKQHADLLVTLGASPGKLVSFIGGGGKTSLIGASATKATETGARVLLTTTTKIWPFRGIPFVQQPGGAVPVKQLHQAWQSSRIVVLGREILASGKIAGLPSETVCQLQYLFPDTVILCEADGSAGRSLKVHGTHEPVVPLCTTTVVVVGGLDAVGRPASAETIHRFDVFQAHGPHEDVIGPETMGQLLIEAGRLAPHTARVVYALNKADALSPLADSTHIRDMLLSACSGSSVLVTSWGEVVSYWGPVAAEGPVPVD